MSNSSSSDEEVNFKLKEAVAKDFISDGLYNGQHTSKYEDTKEINSALPPSLRIVDNGQDGNSLGLNLTPEFRKFVGKQLAAMLDKQLKEVEPNEATKKKRKRHKNQVKLLHSSADYISLSSNSAQGVCAALSAKRKTREVEENSEEERKKIEEAAVKSDWVTSGEAVKGWAKSTRGEVVVGEHAGSLKTAGGKKKKKKRKKEELNGGT